MNMLEIPRVQVDGTAADILFSSDRELSTEIRGWLGANPTQAIAERAYVHASGFIVLRAASIAALDGESQARLHYWPADIRDPNPDKRVHRHGWGLSSLYLYGQSTDNRFAVRATQNSPHGLYAVSSTVLAGHSNLDFEQSVAVEQTGRIIYEPGRINSVPPDAFHATQVGRGDVLTLCVAQVAPKGIRSEVVVENSDAADQIHIERPELTIAQIDLIYSALRRFIG